jgi:aryl carrier-like protein
MNLTHEIFLAAGLDERVQLIERQIADSLNALRPDQPASFDGATHLADLGIDSIQLVEMKFALDQLVGRDLDVSVFIANPTLHELATSLAAAAT